MLQVSSGQFTVFHCIFYAVYSIPQTFTVYQTLAIFLLAIFFGEILAFLDVNNTFLPAGGTVLYRPGQYIIVSP